MPFAAYRYIAQFACYRWPAICYPVISGTSYLLPQYTLRSLKSLFCPFKNQHARRAGSVGTPSPGFLAISKKRVHVGFNIFGKCLWKTLITFAKYDFGSLQARSAGHLVALPQKTFERLKILPQLLRDYFETHEIWWWCNHLENVYLGLSISLTYVTLLFEVSLGQLNSSRSQTRYHR